MSEADAALGDGRPPELVTLGGGHTEGDKLDPPEEWEFGPIPLANIDVDLSDWLSQPECSGEVRPEPLAGSFSLPDKNTAALPFTASVFDEPTPKIGSMGFTITPSYRPQPTDKVYSHAYVTSQEDLSIYFVYSFADAKMALRRYRPEQLLFTASVLVDYEPVPGATMIMWNENRTQKLVEKKASGFMVRPVGDVGVFEVVIPREVFAERRSYEVSMDLNAFGPNTRNDIANKTWQIEVHNERFERRSRPCSEPLVDDEYNAFERKMSEPPYIANQTLAVTIFPEGHASPGRLLFSQRPIAAAPGEQVRVFASFLGAQTDPPPFLHALMPMLDGVPLRERARMIEVDEDKENVWNERVYWRGSFEVTMPQEKGLHAVHVATWNTVFSPRYGLDGEFNEELPFPWSTNSNVIVFDVQ